MHDLNDLRAAAVNVVDRPLAPAPPLEAVARRAQTLRRRRQWRVRAITGGAVVASLLVGWSVWSDGAVDDGRVRTVPADPGTEDMNPPSPQSVTDEADVQPRSGLPNVPPRHAPDLRDPAAPVQGEPKEGAPSETTWRPYDAGEEGCRAYSRPGANLLGPREAEPRCSYKATKPGGYEGAGTWTIEIRRNGATIYLDSTTSPRCARPGVIQPGDDVVAHLGIRQADGSYTNASAGEGEWHITVGTYATCFDEGQR